MTTDFETALEREIAAAGNHRRDKVFAIAYCYHRHGRAIPAVTEMRHLVGRGSNTDITRDLKDFRTLTENKAAQVARLPGLPRDLELKIGDVMDGLWHTLYEKAQAEFEEGRAESDKKVVALETKLDASEKERLQALDERQIVLGRCAELEKQLAERDQHLKVEESTSLGLRAEVTRLQGRVGELDTALANQQREAEARIQGLQDTLKERENRIQDFRVQEDRLKAAYEEKLATARTLETEYRQRAQQAEDIANRLRDELTDSKSQGLMLAEQVGQLKRELAELKQLAEVRVQELVNRNAVIEAVNARLEAAAREVESCKAATEKARQEAKRAGEEAAELRGAAKRDIRDKNQA